MFNYFTSKCDRWFSQLTKFWNQLKRVVTPSSKCPSIVLFLSNVIPLNYYIMRVYTLNALCKQLSCIHKAATYTPYPDNWLKIQAACDRSRKSCNKYYSGKRWTIINTFTATVFYIMSYVHSIQITVIFIYNCIII